MAWARAALVLVVAAAVGVALVSGGSPSDPRTPPALPGLPPPFLGVALVGDGGMTAAVDVYGNVVDLREEPAGAALLSVPAARQSAGTVSSGAAIVPRVRLGDDVTLPFWRADSVRQHYRPRTNVLVTMARFGPVRAKVVYAAGAGALTCLTEGPDDVPSNGTPVEVVISSPDSEARRALRCNGAGARRAVARTELADRRWLSRARPLAAAAPTWARHMYERSLLVLRALTSAHSGAVAAGARDGWTYVWPRDASAAALAFAAAGYTQEARRTAGFLLGLNLDAAARFSGDGAPIEGREAQGDARGWTAVAADVASLLAGRASHSAPAGWRDRDDYQEKSPDDYLGNAIASGGSLTPFETRRGLVRLVGEPVSGLDSAAAWAVRPFPRPAFFPAARRTLLRLAATQTRFGIVPGENWDGGNDPWTAPTAWVAWSLAALARWQERRGRAGPEQQDRRRALLLLADLRRASTPAGDLPERVDAGTGLPVSTTPLTWSHAFAVLTLRELWPARR